VSSPLPPNLAHWLSLLGPETLVPRAEVRTYPAGGETPPSPEPAREASLARLEALREEASRCTACPLHEGRKNSVFADGDPKASLMFIGEGPGRDEDLQGLPFVGRAGRLLTDIIEKGMGLRRAEVYIANVVKCRPPQNRTPTPEEREACGPFLIEQIRCVHPRALVALGATAARYLLATEAPMRRLRGRIHMLEGIPLVVTWHPAYLLRRPEAKRETWEDIQRVMRILGLSAPRRPGGHGSS